MQVQVRSYAVDVLTAHYRVTGELRPRGDPTMFLNDHNVSTLTVFDAVLMPLHQDMRLGAVAADELQVPKTEPQVIILGNFVPEVKPLPKTERLICFTDTYVLRGTFHMGPETQVMDVFYALPGPFFVASRLDIFALYPLAVEVHAMAELAFVQGRAVRAFYQPEEGETGSLA
jgi:hypothetical protein